MSHCGFARAEQCMWRQAAERPQQRQRPALSCTQQPLSLIHACGRLAALAQASCMVTIARLAAAVFASSICTPVRTVGLCCELQEELLALVYHSRLKRSAQHKWNVGRRDGGALGRGARLPKHLMQSICPPIVQSHRDLFRRLNRVPPALWHKQCLTGLHFESHGQMAERWQESAQLL
eukprot:4477463-Prymnesium_polylepis.2